MNNAIEPGTRFGLLTATGHRIKINGRTKPEWLCECGKKKGYFVSELRRGNIQSCGCLNRKKARKKMNKINNRKYRLKGGMVFRRLTVTGNKKRIKGRIFWECRCQCGETRWVPAGNLTSGRTKSCGCYRRDLRIAMNKHFKRRKKKEA